MSENATENNTVDGKNPDGHAVANTGAGEEQEPRSSEAKKYRLRLREAEAERDQLREQLENLQRAEIARLTTPILAKPDSLWIGDEIQLADLLTSSGTVDPHAVGTAAEKMRDTIGLAAPKTPTPKASPGGKSPADRDRQYEHDGFAEAFKPSHRRNIIQ